MVSGLVFGISKTAVTPPSTAAREPVSRSSLCSRPGSRKCTWLSMTPGRMCRPRHRSSRRRTPGRGRRSRRCGRPRRRCRAGPAVMVDDRAACQDQVVGRCHDDAGRLLPRDARAAYVMAASICKIRFHRPCPSVPSQRPRAVSARRPGCRAFSAEHRHHRPRRAAGRARQSPARCLRRKARSCSISWSRATATTAFVLDCRADIADDFVRRLMLYRLRAKVEIAKRGSSRLSPVSWGR